MENKIKIMFGETAISTSAGLVCGKDIRNVLPQFSDDSILVLKLSHKVEVPVGDADYLVLRGKEVFAPAGQPVANENRQMDGVPCVQFNGYGPGGSISFDTAKVTGGELKARDNALTDCRLFATNIPGSNDCEIEEDWRIILKEGDAFITIPQSQNGGRYVDIEVCAKNHRHPPKVNEYLIKIDKEKFKVDKPAMCGQDILMLASKEPTEWLLNQKLSDGKRVRVENDQVIDFTVPGIERFETTPKEVQQGNSPTKPDLHQEDKEFLSSTYKKWELKMDPNAILVYDFLLPKGYNLEKATMMILIPPNYPGANFDMFYLCPCVSRSDGVAINCTSKKDLHKLIWQEWSRHYQQGNPLPSVAAHVSFINFALALEVGGTS